LPDTDIFRFLKFILEKKVGHFDLWQWLEISCRNLLVGKSQVTVGYWRHWKAQTVAVVNICQELPTLIGGIIGLELEKVCELLEIIGIFWKKNFPFVKGKKIPKA
ncbi:hypothetical protein RFI_40221, partial [Reticulomyxa filosa]